MHQLAIAQSNEDTIPVFAARQGEDGLNKLDLDDSELAWAQANGFECEENDHLLVPNANGSLSKVLFGTKTDPDPFDVARLASHLPSGSYKLEGDFGDPYLAALGWLLGQYKFDRYRQDTSPTVDLVLDEAINEEKLRREVEASYLARDLINTPANDLGPDELEAEIASLAKQHNAEITVIKGDDLLENNFPMIHAVGRASANAPRLIDMVWGETDHPKVTLVGKGVIFDTGGLNIKPGSSMALMKKDMGGAANTIALASMIMTAKLPVRLRLLVPAVENAISGNAFRPGDILQSRKGLSVEIGNTDAEGRLILADALALGDEEAPALMIDMATLTGAARVALGPDLPPFYTQDDSLAGKLHNCATSCKDPLWRMPLWQPYQAMLSSTIADVNHISTGGFAGSVTAALFLSRFVEDTSSWVHLDIYGWNPIAKPWSPKGGEAQGIRALFQMIEARYKN